MKYGIFKKNLCKYLIMLDENMDKFDSQELQAIYKILKSISAKLAYKMINK